MTAAVSPATATGIVTFMDGATRLGVARVVRGVAILNTKALGAGSRSITAVFRGGGVYASSTSTALTQTVGQAPTSIRVVASPNPSRVGSAVRFTAIVSPPTATGTVTFMDGATTLGTVTRLSGAAVFITKGLGVGVHSITALLNGTGNYAGSTAAALVQTVN